MTLTQRRILSSFFIIAFLVSSSALILYASGYRYNISKQRIEKVGLLYVTTEPKDTTISIDNQEHNVGREFVLNTIKPGKYQVAISKEGYHTWRKELEIQENQSTFVRDLLLFKNEEPLPFEIITTPIEHVLTTNDFVVFQSDTFLFIYDRSSQRLDEVELADKALIEAATLNVAENAVTFLQNTTWYEGLFDEAAQPVTNVPEETTKLKRFSEMLIALNNEGVWEVDNTGGAPTLLFSQLLPQDIETDGTEFWTISSEPSEKRSFLYYSQQRNTRPRLITALPHSSNYQLVEANNNFVTIYDQENLILYLVETSTASVRVESIFGVHTWEWSKNRNMLLTASEFELTIHHLDHGLRQELIVRLSTPITDAAWHPDEQYVFYVTENKLSLAERDDRDVRNIFLLTEQKENLRILSVDPDGEFIRFSQPNGTVGHGLWELAIR